MANLDSATITSIIALVALLSPVITAIINNTHHTKIRRLEIEEDNKIYNSRRRIQLLENALSAIGKYSIDKHTDKVFSESVFPALPYMSKDTFNKTLELYRSVFDCTNTNECNLTIEVVSLIKEDIKRLLQ